MKKEIKRFAIAGGIIWGGVMFLTTIAALATGYGMAFLQVMASIYPGYTITATGSIVGLIYGFLDVFICVYVSTWVYEQVKKQL